jgi:hypothetical protein
MRWSSRVGDLAKLLFVVEAHTPDSPLQRLRANLGGSNPYTTPADVSGKWPSVRDDHEVCGISERTFRNPLSGTDDGISDRSTHA